MKQRKTFFSFKFDPPEPKKRWRPKRLRGPSRPALAIERILEWADAHHARTGRWPTMRSGSVAGTAENWTGVNRALYHGLRSLPGGSSLARLLAERRGYRNEADLPPLSIEQILAWADAHMRRAGRWPSATSGPIECSVGETWKGLDHALKVGRRSLSGGSSLARLLAERRGHRNESDLPALTIERILGWADEHKRRAGDWPNHSSGPVVNSGGETWQGIAVALSHGGRGLPGGTSLACLLAEQRGRPHHLALPPLRIEQILAWADAHFQREGVWPNANSGPIDGAGETWACIQGALRYGYRGLPGGSSLPLQLMEHRGHRSEGHLPALSISQILAWADTHFRRTGRWPIARSEPVADAPGEKWDCINSALRSGGRGLLPGGTTLHRLLVQHGRKASPYNTGREPGPESAETQ
jgi:hypothetical protein